MRRQAAGKGRGRGRARARSTAFEIASVCPLASGPPRERDPSTWTRRRWRYPRATSTESTTRPRRARYPRASPCSEARRGRDARAPSQRSRRSAGRSERCPVKRPRFFTNKVALEEKPNSPNRQTATADMVRHRTRRRKRSSYIFLTSCRASFSVGSCRDTQWLRRPDSRVIKFRRERVCACGSLTRTSRL